MLSSKCIEFINYQDKLYQVYRKINKGRIKESHILDVRDMWHCDTVLKTKNQEEEIYLFLIESPDAIIVEYPVPSPASIPEE